MAGPKVKYIGTADIRAIDKEDFKRNGITQNDVEWSAENKFTAEVSKEAADFLLGLPDQFELASKASDQLKLGDKPAE